MNRLIYMLVACILPIMCYTVVGDSVTKSQSANSTVHGIYTYGINFKIKKSAGVPVKAQHLPTLTNS
jgi:hypothetical protein